MIHNYFHQVVKNYFQQYHNQLLMKVLTKTKRRGVFFSYSNLTKFIVFFTSGGSVTSSVNCAGGVGANKRSIITFGSSRCVELYA